MRPGASRSHLFWRLICTVSVVIAAASSFVVVDEGRAESGIRRVGSLDRPNGGLSTAANGNIIVDPVLRKAYQATVVGDTTITEVDLGTLRQGRSVTIPRLFPAWTTGGGQWLWTLDSTNHRLFVFELSMQRETGAENYDLRIVDLETMTSPGSLLLWPSADRVPLAIDYYAPSDTIYMFTRLANVSPLERSVFFLEARDTQGRLLWEKPLPMCFGGTDYSYPPTLARSLIQPSKIYLNCYNSGNIQGEVVRVHLDAAGVPTGQDDVIPALPGPLSTMFDRGSDRMFFLTTNSGAGRGVWVFDGLRSTFLGVIASGDSRTGANDYAMGIDPSTGRIYMQTPAGFVVADARRTPLPGGVLFKELANFGVGQIVVDPVSRHVFVPDAGTRNSEGQPQKYMVLKDAIPVSVDPKPRDPDELTTDIEEKSGVTGVNVSGGARGFAFRALTTGGLQKAAWNIALGQVSPHEGQAATIWDAMQSVPLDPSNRDVFAGRVRSLSLTGDATEGSSVFAESDRGTEKDAKGAGVTWPFVSTDCRDEGSDDTPSSASSPYGVSAVTCDTKALIVTGSAGYPGIEISPSKGQRISTGAAVTASSVRKDPERGLVSRSASTINEIDILGTVKIGQLTTVAETWARGRPGTAGATFRRELFDVTVDANRDGVPEFTCASESRSVQQPCEVSAVREQINKALAGQATVEMPLPDPSYDKGTKGGFQAVIEKDRFRGLSERALNDDDTFEVAGLAIVLYSDARAGRTRQVIQFAGVQAEAHYGIFKLPTADGLASEGPDEDLAAEPTFETGGPLTGADISAAAPVLPAVTGPRYIAKQIVERISQGLAIFLASPGQAVLVAVMWALIGLPVYLLHRRRLIWERR